MRSHLLRFSILLFLVVAAATSCTPTFVVESTPKIGEAPFAPGLVCQEQNGPAGTALVLRGEGLSPTAVDIPNDPSVVLPSLALHQSAAIDGGALGGDAVDVVVDGTGGGENAALLSWQSQSQMTFTFVDTLDVGGERGAVPQGVYDLTVTSPDGQTAQSAAALAVVERPHVLTSTPPLLCLAQGPRDLDVAVRGALVVDGAVPAVTVGGVDVVPVPDGCSAIPQAAQDAQVCDTLHLTLGENLLTPGKQVIELTNPAPADCHSDGDNVAVVVVPPPAVAAVSPAAVCADAGVVDLVVSGSGFLVVDDVAFVATVNGAATAVVPADCVDVDVVGLRVQSCTSFSLSVDTATLPVGGVEIAVENPAPAGCADASRALLRVDPVPALSAVDPAGVCQGSGVVSLDVDGSGFAVLDGAVFGVTVGGVAVTPTPTGCVDVDAPGVTLQTCSGFSVDVDAGALPPGRVDIAVLNPGPDACTGSSADLFAVAPAPVIAALTPDGVCSTTAGVVDVVVSGGGFVVDGADAFTVRVDGTATAVVPAGCVDVDLPGGTVQSCSSFSVTIDATGRAPSDIPIVVDNPDLPGCSGSATRNFGVLPPPTVTALSNAEVCSDVALAFEIIGTGFAAQSDVTVGGFVPDSVVVNGDGTRLSVTFDQGLAAGSYDIVVDNGDGCVSPATVSLVVHPTPLVFFVNPRTVWNGIAIDATVFASGIVGLPLDVDLVDDGGIATPLAFADSGRAGRVIASIPAGLDPGDYAVRVTSEFDCQSIIDGTLTITDALTLAVGSVDPAFASPTVATGVTLTTIDPLPAGSEGFAGAPQVYLNPSDGSGSAIALRAVEVKDATTLNAVVSGAAPGVYDVVVVNPDGAVGVLDSALTVTVAEPPKVTSVAPASLDANSQTAVTVFGADFDTAAVEVSLECKDFLTGAVVPVTGAVVVSAATAVALDVDVDASGVSAGAVCVVVVENGDGSVARFSALSFKEPSQNLNAWRPASSLGEARRAPALAAGRPTDSSRFVYAIGGDAGTAATAKTSVEAAAVDAFGAMGAFAPQRSSLPSPRTLAGVARVGRFVYVVGGSDGAAPVATTLRAQILDPLAGPEVQDLAATLGDGTVGLGGGLYIYRVAALFPPTDASNPGGESLGGELFNVELPDLPEKLVLELVWQAVPGASAYRLYRSPAANDAAADLELLAETSETRFSDDGSATTTASVTPLPAGSLGVWHAVSALATAREAPATTAVPDPASPDRFFLYAVGGRTSATTVAASGEVATLTLAADGSQTVSAWRPLTASLSQARAELCALAVTPADTPAAGTDHVVVFTTGRRGNGALSGVAEAGLVGADGDIATLTAQATPNPTRAGAGGFSANGFLFLFGGANGNVSNNDVSSSLLDDTPTIDGWNALGGGSMLTARRFPGTTQESAFFFIAGGETTGSVALTSVEQTVQ